MTLLRLANASEGRAVLAAEDDFTRALGGFDRSFRMRTTARVDDADLRRFLGEQAVDFTEEEAAAWEEAMAVVAAGARGLGGVLPPEVLLVKTTGREERDHAYTRANAIVLPATRVRSLRGERALRPARVLVGVALGARVRDPEALGVDRGRQADRVVADLGLDAEHHAWHVALRRRR